VYGQGCCRHLSGPQLGQLCLLADWIKWKMAGKELKKEVPKTQLVLSPLSSPAGSDVLRIKPELLYFIYLTLQLLYNPTLTLAFLHR